MAVKDFMTRKVVYISPDTTSISCSRFDESQRVAPASLLSKMINWLVW